LPPLPPLILPRNAERTWIKCDKQPREIDDLETNPFGAPEPAKNREMELHPDLAAHLQKNNRILLTGIKATLNEDQQQLLLEDFSTALDHWDVKACCNRIERFKAIEASRYADINSSYGKADVNIAVKLLVPLDAVEDWKNQKKLNIRILALDDDDSLLRCRFSLLPPERKDEQQAAEVITSKKRGTARMYSVPMTMTSSEDEKDEAQDHLPKRYQLALP